MHWALSKNFDFELYKEVYGTRKRLPTNQFKKCGHKLVEAGARRERPPLLALVATAIRDYPESRSRGES